MHNIILIIMVITTGIIITGLSRETIFMYGDNFMH